MLRAIDHLVIPARDLSAQAELYRRLGFQVGARNRHPWGTENHIVQFDGAFLELIGVGAGFVAPAPEPGAFSFAGFVSAFLQRREGLAMLAMRSQDAEADRRRFKAEGLGDFARFDFARKARRPDGREVDVAFSLAFATSPALPETGFFVCQQRFPENFWSRAAQVHPNGATAIAGLTLVCDEPDQAQPFLAAFLDATAQAIAGGVAFAADGTRVECVTPQAYAALYGAPAAAPGLAAARAAVADLDAAQKRLAETGIVVRRRAGMAIIDAGTAMGALIAFVEAAPVQLA
jgi:catechol 2,3-dioxygenase-like lactoylglutathione lyase family enzyme